MKLSVTYVFTLPSGESSPWQGEGAAALNYRRDLVVPGKVPAQAASIPKLAIPNERLQTQWIERSAKKLA